MNLSWDEVMRREGVFRHRRGEVVLVWHVMKDISLKDFYFLSGDKKHREGKGWHETVLNLPDCKDLQEVQECKRGVWYLYLKEAKPMFYITFRKKGIEYNVYYGSGSCFAGRKAEPKHLRSFV